MNEINILKVLVIFQNILFITICNETYSNAGIIKRTTDQKVAAVNGTLCTIPPRNSICYSE
jgi:hypothetical protein